MLRRPICPETLTTFYKNGETIAVIADYFQCDPKTIRRRAAKLGLQHPNAPHRKQERIYTRLDKMNAIQRYEDGESLMALAALGRTSVDVLRPYLKKKGVKIRSHIEQVAMTMAKYGTRFHAKETRLYVYERDTYGLVTDVKIYQNNNRTPIVKRIDWR